MGYNSDVSASDRPQTALIAGLAQSPEGWIGRWTPGIGDPSFMGWLTVLLYAVCAWHCWRTSVLVSGPIRSSLVAREKRLWQALALGFAALGINKQLDLQTAFTELGRAIAFRQGWYEHRGEVQWLFIITVACVASACAVAALWLMWRAPFWTRVAVGGTCLVLGFVVIRAASFHHMDRLLISTLFGVRFNWLLEIGGIGVVVLGAWKRRRRRPQTSTPPGR